MPYDNLNPAAPAAISQKPTILTSDIASTDLLLMVHLADTQNHKNRKVTFGQMLDYIAVNAHELSYTEIRYSGVDHDALYVVGDTTLLGSVSVGGQPASTSFEVNCPSSFSYPVTFGSTAAFTNATTFSDSVTFNSSVDVNNRLDANSVYVNPHQGGANLGMMFNATTAGIAVKDTMDSTVMSVTNVSGATFNCTVAANDGMNIVGATTINGNLFVGTSAVKKDVLLNESEVKLYRRNGLTRTLELGVPLVGGASVFTETVTGQFTMELLVATTGFYINNITGYSPARLGQRAVVHNSSGSTISVQVNGSGTTVAMAAHTCKEFVCVAEGAGATAAQWLPLS